MKQIKINLIIGIVIALIILGGGVYVLAVKTDLTDYFGNKEIQTGTNFYGKCPDLVANPLYGGYIVQDRCTGIFWAAQDEPVDVDGTKANLGYDWTEANTACSGKLGAAFRLPTVDELLTLVNLPCVNSANSECSTAEIQAGTCACSPIADDGAFGTNGQPYNYFANGSYWTATQYISNIRYANVNGSNNYDLAKSVNLLEGKVDDPVISKNISLNVRCVFNKEPWVKGITSVSKSGNTVNGIMIDYLSGTGTANLAEGDTDFLFNCAAGTHAKNNSNNCVANTTNWVGNSVSGFYR